MNPAKFSITDLERLTGIKAATIRIWEKRYGIISPERTGTNIRFYSTTDLQRLLNITFLNKHGFKISYISTMSDEDIENGVARLSQDFDGDNGLLSGLVKATDELDEERFERLMNSSILKVGFENTFINLVLPFLEKISLLWQINKISACQERFVHNLIRHKLVVAIDGLVGQNTAEPLHFLLFMPTGQYDEINLLFANYLLRKKGHQVLYLGPSIPLDHIRSLSNREKIDGVVVNIGAGFTEKVIRQYIDNLVKIFPLQKMSIISSLQFEGGQTEGISDRLASIRNISSLLEV